MKVNFIKFCENIIVENDTNKVSIIGLFDNINSPKYPVIQPTFCVFAEVEAEPGEYDLEMNLQDDISHLMKVAGKIRVADNGKGYWLHKAAILQVPRQSKYNLTIKHNDKEIKNLELEAK